MSFWDRFVRSRRALLSTPDHFRAFAPDPVCNYWPLADRGDNREAYGVLCAKPPHVVAVASGTVLAVDALAPCSLLFVTEWDTYSATEMGKAKRALDANAAIEPVYFVFFESTLDEIRQRKSGTWYYNRALVPPPDLAVRLRALVGRVPFRITYSSGGAVSKVIEGLSDGGA